MNEQEMFLEEIGKNAFEDPLFSQEKPEEEAEQAESEEKPEEDEEQRLKNRRERRLAAKLQAERESAIALAARLEAITEANKTKETESDYLKTIERIYGTDTPEAATATELLKNALRGMAEETKRSALEELREEQRKAQEELKKEEENLDSMVEDIEDEFGTTLTKEDKQGFYRLLEKLSPKDANGDVIAYADPIAVYEEYTERKKRATPNRAKELASRSMTQSGTSGTPNADEDATLKFLKENDLI